MRSLIHTGLVAAGLMTGGCLSADSSLMGPSEGSEDGARSAAASGYEMRIVEPRAGAALMAGEDFVVRAIQELRGGPAEARAQLQVSLNGGDWREAGPAFPWSRRSHEVETMATGLEGVGLVHLRLVVFEEHPERAFLVSSVVSLRCMQVQTVEVVSK